MHSNEEGGRQAGEEEEAGMMQTQLCARELDSGGGISFISLFGPQWV